MCSTLNYYDNFLVFISAASSFALLVGTSVGIASSPVWLKTFILTAGIKKMQALINSYINHDEFF